MMSALRSSPCGKLPVDSSAALPRPRRLRLGSVSGPGGHIGLTARANLGDVARGVGTLSPKRSASSLAPMPKESNTIINVRFICALLRVLTLLRPQNCNRPYSLNLYPMDFKL